MLCSAVRRTAMRSNGSVRQKWRADHLEPRNARHGASAPGKALLATALQGPGTPRENVASRLTGFPISVHCMGTMKSTLEIARLTGTTPRNILSRAKRMGLVPAKFGKACAWTPQQARMLLRGGRRAAS